jgi:hypothetical protein
MLPPLATAKNTLLFFGNGNLKRIGANCIFNGNVKTTLNNVLKGL